MKFKVAFLCVSCVDQSNYKTLFGVLDNCFLVAYAIGMFFRYAFMILSLLLSALWVTMNGLCLQWNIWRARPSALLPELRNADEWIVHLSVRPGLLLGNPLAALLRLHPGSLSGILLAFLYYLALTCFSCAAAAAGHQ